MHLKLHCRILLHSAVSNYAIGIPDASDSCVCERLCNGYRISFLVDHLTSGITTQFPCTRGGGRSGVLHMYYNQCLWQLVGRIRAKPPDQQQVDRCTLLCSSKLACVSTNAGLLVEVEFALRCEISCTPPPVLQMRVHFVPWTCCCSCRSA